MNRASAFRTKPFELVAEETQLKVGLLVFRRPMLATRKRTELAVTPAVADTSDAARFTPSVLST